MDDQHVSEQLEPYARGRLEGDPRRSVEEHLAACPECAAELVAVRSLLEGVRPLTDKERDEIHSGVAAAIARERVAVLPRRGGSKLGRVLGAAAAIALVASGIAYLGTTSGGGDDAALRQAERAPQQTGVNAEEAVPLRPGANPTAQLTDAAAGTTEAAEGAGAEGSPPSGRPRWVPLFDPSVDNYSTADLGRLGRRHHPFTTFAAHYSVDDVDELQLAFLDALAERFPDPPGEDAVRRCAVQVMEGAADTALPAYGRYGKLHGRMTLLLGFTWARDAVGPLDRYMFWAWPRGSCDAPPRYQSGRIRR